MADSTCTGRCAALSAELEVARSFMSSARKRLAEYQRLRKINQETAVGAGAGESGTMPDDDPAPVTPAHQRVIDAALAWHRVRYRGSIMDVLAVERDLYRALEEMTCG